MRHQQESRTIIAIFGGNMVVSNALSILLKGVGFDVKQIEGNPVGLAERLLDGAAVMLFAPVLGKNASNTLLRGCTSRERAST